MFMPKGRQLAAMGGRDDLCLEVGEKISFYHQILKTIFQERFSVSSRTGSRVSFSRYSPSFFHFKPTKTKGTQPKHERAFNGGEFTHRCTSTMDSCQHTHATNHPHYYYTSHRFVLYNDKTLYYCKHPPPPPNYTGENLNILRNPSL